VRLGRVRGVSVALHGVGFPGTCLAVGKDGGVKTLDDLGNVKWDVRVLEDLVLRIALVEYLVKAEGF
jgi:hypothetical protein